MSTVAQFFSARVETRSRMREREETRQVPTSAPGTVSAALDTDTDSDHVSAPDCARTTQEHPLGLTDVNLVSSTFRRAAPAPDQRPGEPGGCGSARSVIECHTMSKLKVAITLEASLLDQVDTLVREHHFPNRSQAIETALAEKLVRLSRARLARECAKLDPAEERRFAEEGLGEDLKSWPAY